MTTVRAVASQHAHLLGRKGAARIALIPEEVLRALNMGAIPTANLNEFLAIDLTQLAPAVAQAIGLDPSHERLQAQRRLAADPHFGVREMAWAAVRDEVIGDLEAALDLLQAWVSDPDDNIRRFASELTRPKGVWCAPIRALQAEPQRALHLLEPLRADPSRYVQNSVANWLNDASKTQGPWVASVCARWLVDSPCDATRYIVRRARRTMDKA